MATGKRENTLREKPAEKPAIEEKPVIEEIPFKEEKKSDGKKQKKPQKEPKSKPPKEKKEKKPSEGRARIIIGILLLCLAIFLFVAFISYFGSFFSGHHQEFGAQVFSQDLKLDNRTGSLGAWLAQTLIKESFGIGAFFFVYLVIVIAFKLLVNSRIRLWRVWKYALLSLVWFPLFFAFIPAPKCAIFGGATGAWLNTNLSNYIGRAGVILVLVFTFLIFAIYQFNITFAYFRKLKEQRAARKAEAETKKEALHQETENQNSFEENPIIPNNNDFHIEDENEDDLPPITSYRKEPEMEIVPPVAENEHRENVIVRPPKVEFEVEQPKDENDVNEPEFTVRTITHEEQETAQIIDIPSPENETPVIIEQPKTEQPEPASDVKLVIEKAEEEKTVEPVQEKEHHTVDTPFDPHYELRDFQFPTLDLLKDYGGRKNEINSEELEANKNKIVETLGNYGIAIDKIKATIGPTVTLYEIVPAAGVRISKIKNLEDDIALSLAALGIRIIAPIPGKGTIGIEVPNSKPETVPMKSVLSSEKFQTSKYALPCAIGKTISNETYVFDLAKMPHILMAGATGQGKSVGLNAIVASLLYSKHPSELKFVMVDPKKVELTLYNRIERHYLAKLPDSEDAIITDTKKVVRTLNSLCIEMDQRYDLLKQAECRNIIEYNEKFKARRLLPTEGHRFLPYIVLIVDEFCDLIMTAGRDVEAPIARLAQLARAIGIHLIIATQRPSVNVITGSIKANFPARIAFRVISSVDSKTILDATGANQLIGKGDMLISTGNDMVRLQCAFIDTPEVEAVTEFIGAQRGYPEAFMLPEVPDEESDGGNFDEDDGDRDSLFEEAAHIVVQTQQGSTSMIQRKLKLGYNRAGRIIDQLEAAGIVGPFAGSKTREVKVANETALEQILRDLYNRDNGI
ncbi:MAG: DNA translocase FtsK [Bacteroidales bacterium]|nr:DNA translocase FtsK [Bacteroidales bacterium]